MLLPAPSSNMSRPAEQLKSGFTVSDYLEWPDEERWELIDGVAYDMSPAPTTPHQDLIGEVFLQTATLLRGKPCRPFMAPFDVYLPKVKTDLRDRRNNVVVQPDMVVICDRAKLDRRGCIGAPDWIVEVLSPYTSAKDQTVKRELYEREGVKEYWLLHPDDRVLNVYRLVRGRYGKPHAQALSGKTKVVALAGLEIDWDLWQPALPVN